MEWKYVSPQWPKSVTFMTVEEMIDKFDLTENQINHLKQVAQNNMTTKQYITQLLAEIKEKGCTISEEVLSGSLDTLVTLAKGEQRLEENRVYMDSLNNSKEIIGHFLTEPEDVMSPSEMVKGDWYLCVMREWPILTYLFKLRSVNAELDIFCEELYIYETDKYYEGDYIPFELNEFNSIRPATREEVLKYFPNEFQ